MSYLQFHPTAPSASGLTKRWMVTSNDPTTILGFVKWFSQWRKYCFFPNQDTVFDNACLGEIADFCRKETLCHKAGV